MTLLPSRKRRASGSTVATPDRRWKGKKRDEGNGGSQGIVLDLELIGDGIFDAVYTVPVMVGSTNQTLSLQVDSGSSDMWIASTSCSSQACTANKPELYDPSVSSTPTGQEFNISYLSGQVSGPIFWDDVTIGGYQISSQALAAASTVDNEPLAPGFSGILGLALPLNSIIANRIPPGTSNAADGAAFSSNLFGITPTADAPSQYFYSLSLSRPGSSKIPALLGLGRHPSALVPDPSKITYSDVLSGSSGTLFWKVEMKAITVYVNGTAKSVDIGRGVSGSAFPQVVVDSGVPYIIGTPHLANGVWGALGISPAQDGNYYVPCDMPLNMTITLDGQQEIPIHPLDLTASSDPSSKICTGLIQQTNILNNPTGDGDMILGVPFLRNVYTVMAYEKPDTTGAIGNGSGSPTGGGGGGPGGGGGGGGGGGDNLIHPRAGISPRLGFLSLTNPTTALSEFHQVRVLNQPLDQNAPTTGGNNHGVGTSSSKKLGVGVEVLLGLMGFFALVGVVFGLRWLVVRRRWGRSGGAGFGGEGGGLGGGSGTLRGRGRQDGAGEGKESYALALALRDYDLTARRSVSQVQTEESQHTLAEEIKKKYLSGIGGGGVRVVSLVGVEGVEDGTERTRVGGLVEGGEGEGEGKERDVRDKEMGFLGKWEDGNHDHRERPSSPDQLADADIHNIHNPDNDNDNTLTLSPDALHRTPIKHTRADSELLGAAAPDVDTPLLTHTRDDSHVYDNSHNADEFGVLNADGPIGMTGIGTAWRGSMIDASLSRGMGRYSSASVVTLHNNNPTPVVSSTTTTTRNAPPTAMLISGAAPRPRPTSSSTLPHSGPGRPRPSRHPTGPRPSSGRAVSDGVLSGHFPHHRQSADDEDLKFSWE
ncbi:acid protease [Rickenella mellea]|uniref:Acid protease n=1 Tax=Rickenella mellea TaxID=50990 RepID=A0A4Y7PKF7_9AGAM|nr:acid protease [Rickenella mellea]